MRSLSYCGAVHGATVLILSCHGIRTEIGRQAEEIVAQGNLVPDDVVLKVVMSKLEALHNKVGLSLFPLPHHYPNIASPALDFRWLPAYIRSR